MDSTFKVCESMNEPPDLVGAWTGRWEEIHLPSGEFVMFSLDVFFPVMYRSSPELIRTFLHKTRDGCIEAFGEWLDTILTTDSIYPE